ncbi:hypothetical protein [Paractinoplanes brasiliensis]|uniref:Uncharacterized protein n=1 Tax=Paractinoplanes brasiliensis TaxID=52695 RepID=A0A4R6K0C5_9ACTN|nr:hypothetical protein [Actinoplanes brasiliensis]TDO42653.1 hypothetical protein C8E87_6428 [Actinoplanes brasiliensis]GID31243.1 hypothetical protein Abr02nite_62260 [Actinoplanes brasiliensis]
MPGRPRVLPGIAVSARRDSRPPSSAAYVLTGAVHLSLTDHAAYRIAARACWASPRGTLDGRRGLTITVDHAATFLAAAVTGATRLAPPYPEVRPADMLCG